MTSSLVGSEMCIRDSAFPVPRPGCHPSATGGPRRRPRSRWSYTATPPWSCLLYTSDAADDM
eukprot:7797298-Prorocentrum_lima.AAC.1